MEFRSRIHEKKLRKLNDTPHFGICPRKQEVDDIVIFFKILIKSYLTSIISIYPIPPFPTLKMLAITACHHALGITILFKQQHAKRLHVFTLLLQWLMPMSIETSKMFSHSENFV